MPGLESLTETLALPWWALLAAALLIVIFAALAGSRGGWQNTIGTLTQVAAVFGVLFLAWNVFDRLTVRDTTEQRRSFQTRLAALNGHALAPQSPLACLDALVGDAFDEPCEKSIFASPESAAAAVSLMAGRVALLREAVTLSGEDPYYKPAIANLRRSLEPDRFGFVAQALATSEQCKPDSCEALALLKNPERITVNLAERTFETYVGRYVADWMGRQTGPAVASAPAPKQAGPAPGAQAAVTPATSSVNVDFPTASSIPPVSIMNNEPGMKQGGTDVEPKPASAPPPKAKSAATPTPRPRNSNAAAPAPAPANAPAAATAPASASAPASTTAE